MGSVQGKIFQIKFAEDKLVRCQADATLNTVVNTSEVEACKPTGVGDNGTTWVDYTEDSRGWDIAFSAQSFADTAEISQADLMELMVDGDVVVEVSFFTNDDVQGFDGTEVQTFSGQGIMTGLTINAPVTGVSTYDVTIQGKGKPTYTRTTITP